MEESSSRATRAARRIVIVGAGPNGLVAAAYLARAGLHPLVLERRPVVGGVATTEEIHPGFRCSPVAAGPGPLLAGVARDLDLRRHGLEIVRPPVRLFAPSPDGRSLLLYDDPDRTAAALSCGFPGEARRYAEFQQSLCRIGAALAPLLSMTPPSLNGPTAKDTWKLLAIGRRFRALSRPDAFRLLRWGPMPVGDLACEWFETEPLRAAVAARGIHGVFAGPRSAGTSANLLLQAASEAHAAGATSFVKGGMGALAEALARAARSAGAEIRREAEVARIDVRGGAVTGVTLESGEEIPARAVVSSADPRRTFLGLLDPADLDPEFLVSIRNYRSEGSAAKAHLALSGLPRFTALEDAPGEACVLEALSGRIQIGPDLDSLERAFDAAKYGRFSPQPYCEVTLPSIGDPSLAPPGCHVLSAHVQYAPYTLRDGDWQSRREELGDALVWALSRYAPNLTGLIVGRRILTPLDLEETYGLTGGHLFHGEHALDQLFAMRPVPACAQYRTPIVGLFLCGSGTHPGGGVTGAPGANASREIVRDLRRDARFSV